MKYCYIDLETTGLTKQHGVIEVGIILEVDDVVVEKKEFLMQPIKGDLISKEALHITGYTVERLRELPQARVQARKILRLMDKYIDTWDKNDKFILVGHNINGFDFTMFVNLFDKLGIKYLGSRIDYRVQFDTLSYIKNQQAIGSMPRMSNKLGDLCDYFGIKLDNAHNALADIQATRELFKLFMDKEKTKEG